MPESAQLAHKDFPTWEQAESRALSCFASCVHDQMLGYIRNGKMSKEAWENLKKIFAKLQLRHELSNIRQREMTMTNYTMKIKEICDTLGSINVTVDEVEMVRADSDDYLHEGETTVVFRPTIDAYGRRKPCRCVKKYTL